MIPKLQSEETLPINSTHFKSSEVLELRTRQTQCQMEYRPGPVVVLVFRPLFSGLRD